MEKMIPLKKLLIYFLMCIIYYACSSNTTIKKTKNNKIDLSVAINNKKKIMLSSIADSVSFLPLETKPNVLVGNNTPTFSENHIFYGTMCFDWNGKFINKIGLEGRGPGEDMYHKILYLNNHFYSKGLKYIEYDSIGNYTGKEKSFYSQGMTDYAIGKLTNVVEFTNTQKHIILYNYPDSLFFLDTDFNIKGAAKVLDYSPGHWINTIDFKLIRYTSFFNDTLLFYNFFNDTVYHVANNYLIPRWIIHIDKAIRTPNGFLYNYEKLLSAAGRAYLAGNVENSELIKMTDRTNMVLYMQETDHYLFFVLQELKLYARYRNTENTAPYVIYWNKDTEKIITTETQGFVDDLTGLGYFLPKYGFYDNKMISVIFPHQLQDLVLTAQQEGKQISSRLMTLAEKVEPNDNPILIIVHLKK